MWPLEQVWGSAGGTSGTLVRPIPNPLLPLRPPLPPPSPHRYAREIGIDPAKDKEYLWLAEEFMMADVHGDDNDPHNPQVGGCRLKCRGEGTLMLAELSSTPLRPLRHSRGAPNGYMEFYISLRARGGRGGAKREREREREYTLASHTS